eukprot:gene10539-12469_t
MPEFEKGWLSGHPEQELGEDGRIFRAAKLCFRGGLLVLLLGGLFMVAETNDYVKGVRPFWRLAPPEAEEGADEETIQQIQRGRLQLKAQEILLAGKSEEARVQMGALDDVEVLPIQGVMPGWRNYTETLGQELKSMSTHGVRTLIVGDEFVEMWGGKLNGKNCTGCEEVKSLFAANSLEVVRRGGWNGGQSSYGTVVSAVYGDSANNLLFRVMMEDGFAGLSPLVCAIYIGMHDLEQ